MNLVLNFLVLLATVLGSWMAFPQARRIARTREVDGVSATWIGVSLGINAWWLVYGVTQGVWALVPVSVASLVLYGVMAVGYLSAVRLRALPGFAFGVFGLGMIPLPFLLLGGWAAAGIAIGLCYGVQLLPAVVAACRTNVLTGVSAATWLIAWLEAVIWVAYGLGVDDAALMLAGGVGAAMASIILVRLVMTGHRPFAVLVPRRRLQPASRA
ncbi:MAG: hypothetical protein WBP59_10350 [Ilumatobacteraceae bacterium]